MHAQGQVFQNRLPVKGQMEPAQFDRCIIHLQVINVIFHGNHPYWHLLQYPAETQGVCVESK
jgi:hypothetical protein